MKKVFICSILLISVSFTAMAKTPSFNFIQAGYVQTIGNVDSIRGVNFNDIDLDENEFNGVEYKVNFKVSEHFYLNADYLDVKTGIIDPRFPSWTNKFYNAGLGAGYIVNLTENSAFFTQLDIKFATRDNSGEVNRIAGYILSLGSRTNLSDKLEINYAVKPTFYDISNENGVNESIRARVFLSWVQFITLPLT